MPKLEKLMEVLGKEGVDADLRDDPIYIDQSWEFRKKRSGREATFLGNLTSVDKLLEFCGYERIEVDILARKGEWEIFQNNSNTIGLYIGKIPIDGKEKDIFVRDSKTRFLVRALNENITIDRFKEDLEIITAKALETDYYKKRRKVIFAALSLSLPIAVSVLHYTVDPQFMIDLKVTAESLLLGYFGSKFWMKKSYPAYAHNLHNISENAKSYEFTSKALNNLKLEAFGKIIEFSLVPVEELSPEQCHKIYTITEAKTLEPIAISAVPVSQFKSPYSMFKEEGKIKGDIHGTFSGFGFLFFSGTIDAKLAGSYEGSGEIQGIRENTPIEWLMKDSNGNHFVVWDYHLTDIMKEQLKELSGKDLSIYERDWKNYGDITAEQLNKFSLNNSHLFYARILDSSQVPVKDRQQIKLYGQVMYEGKLPIIQLIGFEDENGQKIITQKYPIALLSNGMQNALERLGYKVPELTVEAPKLLDK